MKKRIVSSLLCCFLLLSSSLFLGGTHGKNNKIIKGIVPEQQETPVWCWAAVTEMVASHWNKDIPQCDQANYYDGLWNDYDRKIKKKGTAQSTSKADTLGVKCCGKDLSTLKTEKCTNAGYPQLTHYGFAYDTTTTGTALTWDQIKEQVDKDDPVIFSWFWKPKGAVAGGKRGKSENAISALPVDGHMMVLVGYKQKFLPDIGGFTPGKIIYYYDPLHIELGMQQMQYANFVSGSDHTHNQDFYNIHPIEN